MARARNIKPGFFTNAGLVELDPLARLLFIGLWCLADREGRLVDRPKTIKLQVLPGDACDVNVLLQALHDAEFIVRYKNPDGSFIAIPGFSTHQSPHYSEKPSVIKPTRLPESHGYEEREIPREVRDKPESSPRQVREHSGNTPGAQPPDSLISDSLNPDSTQSPSKRSASAGGPATPPETAALASLRVVIEADKRITLPAATARMHLAQWVRDGLTAEQLALAIRIARDRKPHPELVPFKYLVPIVEDVKSGRAAEPDEPRGKAAAGEAMRRIQEREEREAREVIAPGADDASRARVALDAEPPTSDAGEELVLEDGAWWDDPDRVMAHAMELQVSVFEGESFGDFTARVLAMSGPGPHMEAIDEGLRERVQYFIAVGANSDAARPQAS